MKTFALALLLTCSAVAGPPGDYGDAPVGNTGQGVLAYPGVLARWDTLFAHTNTVFNPQRGQGAWLNPGYTGFLGTIPPAVRFDSALDPALPENDCTPVILFDGPAPPAAGPNPIAECEVTISTNAGHVADQPLYLNIWVDQNRDGKWQDGYYLGTPLAAWNLEWCVQDVPVHLPPNTTARVNTSGLRLESPLAPVWIRVMVTDEPVGAAFRGPPGTLSSLWDSTMTAAHAFRGEIEDHLLNYQAAQPGNAPVKGVWWRPHFNNPGGAAPPKPACDLFYKGPWRVATSRCNVQTVIALNYTSSSRNNGCLLAPALWAMYGPKYLQGVVGPPIVGLNPPLPPGAVPAGAAPTIACPPPFAAAITLPAGPIFNEGPMIASLSIPEASLTGPPRLRVQACYPPPPPLPPRLRFRAYRVFFHTQTCGSVHVSRTVLEHADTGMTLTQAVVGGPGSSADYCDLEHGGLEEDFVDISEGRPFPDPDFSNYVFELPSPSGSDAALDSDVFLSPPSSLRLRRASYLTTPSFPSGYEADVVELWHMGVGMVTLVSSDGTSMTAFLDFATEWQPTLITMPPGFHLQSLRVDNPSPSALRVDNLGIDLRPVTQVEQPPCDPDFNADGNVDQDDVTYLINVISGGDNPTGRDPDYNADGNADQDDITALINTIAGAGCP